MQYMGFRYLGHNDQSTKVGETHFQTLHLINYLVYLIYNLQRIISSVFQRIISSAAQINIVPTRKFVSENVTYFYFVVI